MSSIIWIVTTFCIIFLRGPFNVGASSTTQTTVKTTSVSTETKLLSTTTTDNTSELSTTDSTGNNTSKDITTTLAETTGTTSVTDENESTATLATTEKGTDTTLTTTEGSAYTTLTTTESSTHTTLTTTESSTHTTLSTTESSTDTTLTTTESSTDTTLSTTESSTDTTLTITESSTDTTLTTTERSTDTTLTTAENGTETTLTTTENGTETTLTSTENGTEATLTTAEKGTETTLTTTENGTETTLTTTENGTETTLTTTENGTETTLTTAENGTETTLTTTENGTETTLTTTKLGTNTTLTTTESDTDTTLSTSDYETSTTSVNSISSLSSTEISSTPVVSTTPNNIHTSTTLPPDPKTSYPTQVPMISDSSSFSFQFDLHLNGTFNESLSNDTNFISNVIYQIGLHIFGKYRSSVEISITNISNGSILAEINNTVKIKYLGYNPVEDFHNFKKYILQNVRSNLMNIDIAKYGATENTTDEIISKIGNQLNNETIQELICTENYCPKSHTCTSSGQCVHKCDFKTDHCSENGVCYFDFLTNDLRCRCEMNTLTVYYGPSCEQESGRLEYILGFSLGIGGAIFFIIIVCVCCYIRKNRKGSSYSRSAKHLLKDCDNEVKMHDLNYRWSDREYRDVPLRYETTPGHTNQAYEPLGNVKRSVVPSEMYLPGDETNTSSFESSIEQAPSLLNIDSSRDYSIKRPNIYNEPTEDYDSPYRIRQSFLHQKQEKYQIEGPKRYGMDEIRTTF